MSSEKPHATTAGYAISYSQWVLGSWRFRIVELTEIPKNSEGHAALPKGEFCTLLAAGAPLPEDSDTILPAETVEINGDFILPDTSVTLNHGDHTHS